MERDYRAETSRRVAFIRNLLASSGATGIVYGNSGGKDSALVGILCKMACRDTLGVILPCGAGRNYGMDRSDAEAIAGQYQIETRTVDLTGAKNELAASIRESAGLTDRALANIAPRLRMATLYAIAAGEGRLVAGTGNRSEWYMGYFTKWGDGGYDFNPIADLAATEVYDFLRYLGAPGFLFGKAPSAGLFDGQTDEEEMGVTYCSIDNFLLTGQTNDRDRAIIEAHHAASAHKREAPARFPGQGPLGVHR